MKLSLTQKLAIVGEVVTELSVGWLIILQLIIMVIVWNLLSGSGQIIGSLPNWAIAAAGGGAACLMVAAFMLKMPKLFFVPVVMIVLLAIQIGSMGIFVSDPDERIKFGAGQLPSFADLVTSFSWFIVIGLALGGLVSVIMIAERKGRKNESKK